MNRCSVIIICSLALIVIISMMFKKEKYESIRIAHPGSNQYVETCDACLPSEGDPNIWTQKCVIRDTTNRYPLLYYTMEKTCSVCEDKGNRIKACRSYEQPSGKFLGTTLNRVGMGFCDGADGCQFPIVQK